MGLRGLLLFMLCSASSSTMEMYRAHTKRLAEFGVDMSKKAEEQQPRESVWHERLERVWHSITFPFLLKSGALTSSVMMTLSPIRTINKIRSAQSTLKYAPYPFFLIFAVAFQWCVYGIFAFKVTANAGFMILVYSNILGVFMGAFYSYTYFNNIQDPKRYTQFWMTLQLVMVVYAAEAVLILEEAHPRALLIVGTVSAIMSVTVSASPLFDLPEVIRTQSSDSMPKDVVLATFFSSALWLSCAFMLKDLWILVPNAFGLVLGSLQILLLVMYGRNGKGADRKPVYATDYGTLEVCAKAKMIDVPYPEEVDSECGPIILADGTGGTL